jgi:acyl CoA:acetate/3-ketoacid CoA transferase alpha subunit/acyl CoA:acetate/3-ketoacid CoA transferase beta subunit
MKEEELRKLIELKFQIPVVEGEDKTCTLEEAIKMHVKEKMVINISAVGSLIYQLMREFWGKQPDFTFITQGIASHLLALIYGKFTRKVVTSFAGISYPSPSPHPIVQRAYLSGEVEFENWTMRTISQMLLAGAMGWGFIPTNSLMGSSMEEENRESFKVMDDPFSQGERIGLLKALRPDITLLHGVAADRSGNTIMTYPLGADAFGAWASQKGVIVSVEKIVPTEYIRRHAHLVRVPSYKVLAVCETPYGSHPSGMTNHGLPEFEAYFPDYDFVIEVNEASLDEEEFPKWIQHWILDCKDHSDYLSKMGKEKMTYLIGKAKPDAWKSETQSEIQGVDFKKQPNPLEMLVAAGGRIIADKCIAEGYKTILAGIGLSNLAAWLAAYALRERGHIVDLMAEIGMYGYLPRASDPTVFSYHNMHTCKLFTNVDTTLGYFVGGSSNQCLGVLGAGQIDKFGNANSTKIPAMAYLVGSGGSNDIASTNSETVVVMNSGRMRLVEKVPYITYPGKNVRTLITDAGVFEKVEGRETFSLTAYIPSQTTQDESEIIATIQEKVGWELDIAAHLVRLEPPTEEEITLLRLYDPRGYFRGE